MKKTILQLITLGLLLSLTACSVTPKYNVTVDAIATPNLTKTTSMKSVQVKPLTAGVNPEGLIFQKHKRKLLELLQTQGYRATQTAPDEIIYLDYGIDLASQQTDTYIEPDIQLGFSFGYPSGFYGHRYYPFWNDFNYYRSYQRSYNIYNRHLSLLSKTPLGRELWRVDVSSMGQSNNLKKIIPLLLESALPYIGKNTDEPIKIIVREKSSKKE